MNKKLLALGATVGTLAGLYTALDLFLFYEVFNSKATIPTKIDQKNKAKIPEALKKPDPRSIWTGKQPFERCEMIDGKNQKLCAWYLPAEKESKTFILGAHGYRSRGKGEFRFISKYYHESGYNLFLIDHQGEGESEGSHITFGHDEKEAVVLWIEYLKNRFGDDINIILHGISMGCATVTMLCSDNRILPNVKYIIADCGFTTVADQFKSVLKGANIPYTPILQYVFATNRLLRGFSLYDVAPINYVKKAIVPMLFVHGGRDNFVPTEMVYELYNACASEKDILVVEGAGHTASYRKDPEAYEKKIEEFTNKYIRAEGQGNRD